MSTKGVAPGIRDNNVSEVGGIRPYKLDLVYATPAAFLTAKSSKGFGSTTAEVGDFFYDSTLGGLRVYDGTSWVLSGMSSPVSAANIMYDTFPDDVTAYALATNTAATGTAGDENVLLSKSHNYEYHILGTQTITARDRDWETCHT